MAARYTSNETPSESIVLLQDLVGLVLLGSSVVQLVLLELTRRRVLSLQDLAFVLSAFSGIVSIGGFLDHQLSDDQLGNIVYGFRLPWYKSIVSTPSLLAGLTTCCLVAKLWKCSCSCCCIIGARAQSHSICRSNRFMTLFPVYLLSFVFVFTTLGARLNARLRHSSIQPTGGTLHWCILHCPMLFSATHCTSVLLVLLRLFLDHLKQDSCKSLSTFTAEPEKLIQAQAQLKAQADKIDQMVLESKRQAEELARAQRCKHDSPRQAIEASLKSSRQKAFGRQFKKKQSQPRQSYPPINEDVSALISSDSESDEEGENYDEYRPASPYGSTSSTFQSSDAEGVAPEDCWIECYDEDSGSIYYYCEATGESRWDDPSLEGDYQHPKWE